MKCIILAAGYATRLYPLTKNYPKPLLEVKGKKILDYLIEDIDKSNMVDEYIVVSNHKFANIFNEWAKSRKEKITVLDDETNSNETRLGAVKDILFVINKLKINEDCLIIAGDNLLDFSLTEFINYANGKNATCVMRQVIRDKERLKRTGVLEINDNNDKVLSMEEKPENPKTNYACPPFYYVVKKDIKKVSEALEDGCAYDAPGSLISWLCKKTEVYSFLMPGNRYDIGNLESYEYIKNNYKSYL